MQEQKKALLKREFSLNLSFPEEQERLIPRGTFLHMYLNFKERTLKELKFIVGYHSQERPPSPFVDDMLFFKVLRMEDGSVEFGTHQSLYSRNFFGRELEHKLVDLIPYALQLTGIAEVVDAHFKLRPFDIFNKDKVEFSSEKPIHMSVAMIDKAMDYSIIGMSCFDEQESDRSSNDLSRESEKEIMTIMEQHIFPHMLKERSGQASLFTERIKKLVSTTNQ